MANTGYRQLGGWALVINGLVGVLLAVMAIFSMPRPDALVVVQLIGILLVIIGLPAIQLAQPATGRLGWLGIGLMELAAVIAFAVVSLFWLTNADIPSAVPFTSALAGFLGNVIVGYLTVRARVFPAWIGWTLAAWGVVNFASGLAPDISGLGVVVGLFEIAGAVAIAGYGWSIVQGLRGATLRPA